MMIYYQAHNSLGNYNYNSFIYNGIKYMPHFHKNYELIHLLLGEMQAVVDGKAVTLKEGDSILVFPGQAHSFDVPRGSQAAVTVFSKEYISQFDSTVNGLCGESLCFTMSEETRMLYRKHIVDDEGSILMKKACFYAICDEFLSQIKLSPRKERSDDSAIEVLSWVSKHYAENITLADAADRFGYEYHYLSRLLNKTYHVGFSQLVNGYRVEKAIELLTKTELTMAEIVSQSGFQSIRNFNLAFQTIVGKKPKDFRISAKLVEEARTNDHA